MCITLLKQQNTDVKIKAESRLKNSVLERFKIQVMWQVLWNFPSMRQVKVFRSLSTGQYYVVRYVV